MNDEEPQSDRQELVNLIQDLVIQSCNTDSFAISAYAEAMRLLAREGRCRILSECGRRVIIEWIAPNTSSQKPRSSWLYLGLVWR